jgi:hypothetical protein
MKKEKIKDIGVETMGGLGSPTAYEEKLLQEHFEQEKRHRQAVIGKKKLDDSLEAGGGA